jgi:hypothetical protein
MGLAMKGALRETFRVAWVFTDASSGSRVVQPGRRITSLNVRALSAFLNLSRKPISNHSNFEVSAEPRLLTLSFQNDAILRPLTLI